MDTADWVLLLGVSLNVLVLWYWLVGRHKPCHEDWELSPPDEPGQEGDEEFWRAA